MAVFSQGCFSRLTFLEVICLPTVLSNLNNLRLFTDRALFIFLDGLSLVIRGITRERAGNRDACKYMILYRCNIAFLIERLKLLGVLSV